MQFTPYIKPNVSNVSNNNGNYEQELSRLQFEELLKTNPGKIILKFGATWCGPCKRIEAHVEQWFNHLSKNDGANGTLCIIIDVDDSFDLYGAFKTKRQVSGIPAILCFKKGNLTYIPDDSVTGADNEQVNAFFKRLL